MTNTVSQTPHDQRFNNLCKGDTLERFEWFEIMACREDEPEGEPPRVYRRVKLSKDEPYDTEKTHPVLHG